VPAGGAALGRRGRGDRAQAKRSRRQLQERREVRGGVRLNAAAATVGEKGCGGQTQASGGRSHRNGGGAGGGQPAAPIASCSGTDPFMGPISAMPASSSCSRNQWTGEWAGSPGCNHASLWGRVLNEQNNEGQNRTWAGREQGTGAIGC